LRYSNISSSHSQHPIAQLAAIQQPNSIQAAAKQQPSSSHSQQQMRDSSANQWHEASP
jgi:hypothetical protein